MSRIVRSAWLVAALAATVGTVGTGCQYARHRLWDASDIAHVGAGVGVGVNVRATNWLQGGAAVYGPRFRADVPALVTFGLARDIGIGRTMDGPHHPAGEMGIAPLVFFRGNDYQKVQTQRSVLLFKTHMGPPADGAFQRWYDPGTWALFPDVASFRANYDRRLFDVGFSGYLGLGFDLALNPYELVDFILGFFAIDISADDVEREPPPETPEPTGPSAIE